MTTQTKQKIGVKLFCLVVCLILLEINVPMTVNATDGLWILHPGPLRKCIDFARYELGEVLHPDYTMNPYYLRLDLNGDNAMEYITILVGSDGKIRRGLLVCSEDGKSVVYRGEDRHASTESPKASDSPLSQISTQPRIVEDLVLIQKRSSQTLPPESYAALRCCEVDGEIKILDSPKSSTVISIGPNWRPLSKRELLQQLDDLSIPIESIESVGEGVYSTWWETYTLGFMDGNQFRWLVAVIGGA